VKANSVSANAISSVAQVAIGSASLFILYRYLLQVIGPEKLGIWSLVLAASSAVQLANLGFTASISKFVAAYEAVRDETSIVAAVDTAVVTLAIFGALFVALAYVGGRYYLAFSLHSVQMQSALQILPWALIAFWMYLIGSVYQSALFGCRLIVQRNYVLAAESVTHLVLCGILAPKYGLMGLAAARLTQNLITLLAMVVLMQLHIPTLSALPTKWSTRIFKEMFGYAASFQVLSLLAMIADPITKGLLARFGTTSGVGYYDMANRLVMQLRAFIINAYQVLIPVFARLQQTDPGQIRTVYLKSNAMVIFVALPAFLLLMLATPLISDLWIGRPENMFIVSVLTLSVGWLFNSLSIPAYFAEIGTGKVATVLILQVFSLIGNLGFGVLLGGWLGMQGVVLATAGLLAFGGIILNAIYFHANGIPYSFIVPQEIRLQATATLLAAIAGVVIYRLTLGVGPSLVEAGRFQVPQLRTIASLGMLLAYSAIVIVVMMRHAFGRLLAARMLQALPGR